ncbi:hypothetical protein [Microbacterium sp.]|uniref:hypothetical protein n=1 Tax=Microbacterium sp. TaxID=51671 RepID=UPI0028A894AC|nr:hypothetical protein [Microbacterium sp.]
MSSDSMNHDDASTAEVPPADAAVVGRPDLQPDSQGDEPLDAELGDDGQGDLAEGDEQLHSGDAPTDLRTEAPSGEVHEKRAP